MGPGSYPWAGSRTPGVDKHQPCPDLAALKVNKETTNGIRTFKKKSVWSVCAHTCGRQRKVPPLESFPGKHRQVVGYPSAFLSVDSTQVELPQERRTWWWGKGRDGKAMENLSHIRDENGLEAPLTAANLSLKITSTQLDQEFYLGPIQTNKKNTHQLNCWKLSQSLGQ